MAEPVPASSNPPDPDSPAELASLSREQVIARIRSSSKDAVILAEMQRLGFWPRQQGQPTLQEALITQEANLSQQLHALSLQLQTVQDPQAALKAMRRERMAQARARREATRQQRARLRYEKAQQWFERRQSEVLYLGPEVSSGLNQAQSDSVRLQQYGLPPLHSAQDLALAIGISLAELRFLAFERKVSRISHYRRFSMAKKSGGERIISAPMPRLKRAQYWILDNLLNKVPLHPAAHGFVGGRSIVSNAAPHAGQALVINLDLQDFFPSIGMARIKGVFRTLGFSEQVATTLALLCSEAPTEAVSVDGEAFHVGCGPRVLPQGAPSSPALTNILCKRLDARLQACAAKLGFRYTRYADDLTFSAGPDAQRLASKLLWRAKQIVIDEGFTPHPNKQQVMRASQRQAVTGIVVNKRPTLARATLHRFRATLFQVEKDGPAGKQWNGNPNVLAALVGYAQFVRMVDADKGTPLLGRALAARARWSGQAAAAGVTLVPAALAKHSSDFRALSAQGKQPWPDWWQPAAAPAPILEQTREQVQLEKRQVSASQPGAITLPPAISSSRSSGAGERPLAPAEASSGKNKLPWLDFALQLGIALLLALSSRNPLLVLVAVLVWLRTTRTGRAHWFLFGAAMLVTLTLLSLLK